MASRKATFRDSATTRERLEEIALLAEAIADEHCPVGAVAPTLILEKIGVTSSYGFYGDYFDGLLEWNGTDFHVFCNLSRVERRESPRARFTLGHELGHYFIDEHRHALQASTSISHLSNGEFESNIVVEQEADEFSASLLMPKKRFHRQAKSVGRGLSGVLTLAETFGTSITSTAIRYAQSDIVPCTFIKWNPSGFAWKWLSNSTFQARYCRTIESAERVVPGSATRRALNGEKPSDGAYFEAGTTAAAWFPSVGEGAKRDVIMVEQAISLGRFGALTLLIPDGRSF